MINDKTEVVLDWVADEDTCLERLSETSALILIRWFEFISKNRKKEDSINLDFLRLADELNDVWSAISHLKENELDNFLKHSLSPKLHEITKNKNLLNYSSILNCLSYVIDNLSDYSSHRFVSVEWISDMDFPNKEELKSIDKLIKEYITFTSSYFIESCNLIDYSTIGCVSNLIVQALKPQPTETIYGPCFGTGNLLLKSAQYQNNLVDISVQNSFLPNVKGFENNHRAFIITAAQFILSGLDPSGLCFGDSLALPINRVGASEQFDVIVAVPPWGGRVSPKQKEAFPIQSYDSENLFLQHVMASLKDGGRAAIILPDKFLQSTLKPNILVRKKLLNQFHIQSMISFSYFYSNATILIFRKQHTSRQIFCFDIRTTPKWSFEQSKPEKQRSLRRSSKNIKTSERFKRTPIATVRLDDYNFNNPEIEENPTKFRDDINQSIEKFLSDNEIHYLEHAESVHRIKKHNFELIAKLLDEYYLQQLLTSLSGSSFRIPLKLIRNIAKTMSGITIENEQKASLVFDDKSRYKLEAMINNSKQKKEDSSVFVTDLSYCDKVYNKSTHPTLRFIKLSDSDVKDFGLNTALKELERFNFYERQPLYLTREDIYEIKKLIQIDISILTLEKGGGFVFGYPFNTKYIPLIKLSNLKGTDIYKPTQYVIAERISKHYWDNNDKMLEEIDSLPLDFIDIDELPLVEEGDVVFSTFGEVGNVAVASKDIAGSTISQGLCILRLKEGVIPEYFAAILRSSFYREWFKSNAKGTTVQKISINKLSKLMIPLPSIKVQNNLINLLKKDPEQDAFMLLCSLFHESKDNLLILKAMSPSFLTVYKKLEDINTSSDRLKTVGTFLNQVRELYDIYVTDENKNIPANQTDFSYKELVEWIESVETARACLNNIALTPEGTARFALLKEASLTLSTLLEENTASTKTGEKCKNATQKIIRVLQTEAESMLQNIDVLHHIRNIIQSEDGNAEIIIGLKNNSVLPLLDFRAVTKPEYGKTSCEYLGEKSELTLPLQVAGISHSKAGFFDIKWSARRLDGKRVRGTIPVSLKYSQDKGHVEVTDIGTNPYIVGKPVVKRDRFFGRGGIIQEIKRQLSPKDTSNVILLEGNRRSGKTSILKYLDFNNILPDWVLVDISLQGITGHDTLTGIPTKNFYPSVAAAIGEVVHKRGIPFHLPGMQELDPERLFKVQFRELLKKHFSGDNYFEDFEAFLRIILDAIKPLRLLLMFDEFDKLQEGIDSGVTSPQIPENIRYLLHTYSDTLSAIITGSRRLKRLREEYWSVLFGLGHRIGVSALPVSDAKLLITKPVENRLVFIPEACDYITELTACHPFLIQSLCDRIFERAARMNQFTVTLNAVKQSSDEMLEDNEHFRTLWDYVETERRRLILAFCAIQSDSKHKISLKWLEKNIEESGVIIPKGDRLADDITFLRELELIDLDKKTGVDEYRIAIPLMGEWINMNIDMAEIKQKAVLEGRDRI